MPWKLLFFILITAIVLTFVGFNLDNRSDISVVFHTFEAVPVVVTMLSSFLFGLLVAFFFALGKLSRLNARKARDALEAAPLPASSQAPSISPAQEIAEAGSGPKKPAGSKASKRRKPSEDPDK